MTDRTAQRLHICFLTGTLNAMAGAERMTATIANALAERGFAVSVLSLWDPSSCFPLHPAITHETLFDQRPSFKRAYAATVIGIRRHVKRHRIDVLIQVDTMLALFALPATLGLGVRHIAWEHCHFDEDLGRRARRLARHLDARYCEHVVALTERDRNRWIEAARPRGSVACIPNPLPFAMPTHPALRTAKIVLAVGRLVRAKGFDVLLYAWAAVAKQAPGWKLMIVGEGDERPALEALCSQLALDNSVELPGIHLDVTKAYEQASIFCLSSRYEGFGLVLIEAMAYGLPIVSTDCETGPRELLSDGQTAVVVPVENAAALAAGLLHMINSPDAAARLGETGRGKANAYSLERITRQWEMLLQRSP